MKRKFLIFVFLISLVGAAFGFGRITAKPEPVPIGKLPEDTIPVGIVDFIPLPPEIVYVPGPAPPPKVVEKLTIVTAPVDIPDPILQTITKWLPCDHGDTEPQEPLRAAISVDATKYEGEAENGLVAFGWAGTADCSLLRGEESVILASEPFDFASSRAVTIYAPPAAARRPWTLDARLGAHSDGGLDLAASWHRSSRWGFYVGFQTGNVTKTFTLEDPFGESSPFDISQTVSTGRIYGGLEFTLGRRYP